MMPRPFSSCCVRSLLAVLVVASAGLLAACGPGSSGGDVQIAVKVNKGEISVHQVQAILQRQPRQIAGDRTETASARVLEVLIDQELAAQAARAEGLDNDPRVVQAIEAARRELLAHAYQERTSERATGPSSDEIDRYYSEHPALFSQRRMYMLQETSVDPAANTARVQSVVDRAQSADELVTGLREVGARHSTRLLAQAAEDLPLTLLESLATLEAGRSVLVTPVGPTRIFTVLYAHKAPVDRRSATNAIGSYLTTERRSQLVVQAMKKLRDEAKIEYVGNFARPKPTIPAAAAASN